MDEPRRHELDRLSARVVEGLATCDDIAALESLLDGDVAAQRRYVHYVDLHAELDERSGRGGLTDRGGSRARSQPRHRRCRPFAIALVAVVVVAAIGVGLGRWLVNPADPRGAAAVDVAEAEATDDGVAVLVRGVDTEWLGPRAPSAGAILSPGRLRLNAGLVQIEFYNGAELVVEGPADLEIVNVSSVVCRAGKVRAVVPPHAIGFTVRTPRIEVVDLGTEFAVDVGDDGRSGVHVFDGEVEVNEPDASGASSTTHVLRGGSAMQWSTTGPRREIASSPESFATIADVRDRERVDAEGRLSAWRQWTAGFREDPRLVARYDFESDLDRLLDVGGGGHHGTIVGCEWTTGRWSGKNALEFKRPGDRVRIDLPGEFEALTVAAWVRVDALPPRRQSLILTDGYEIGRLHWQIGPQGELRIGTRLRERGPGVGSRHASPPVFTPRRIGVWTFVCSVYDQRAGTASHWLDGQRIASEPLKSDRPIRIGRAEIGNWGQPSRPGRLAVRNFVGRIDELTVWNVALDGERIAEIHRLSRP